MSRTRVEAVRRSTAPAWKTSMASRIAGIAMAAAFFGAIRPTTTAAAQSPTGAPTADRGVALVTGSTDGLGREVALRLGASGMHVIVHGRNEERGREVVARIDASGGSAHFVRADFASLDDIRSMIATVRNEYDRIDVLVNNAGIGRGPDDATREESSDGYELRFAVNYLSHFLLTRELLPLLESTAPARIINVASSAQSPIDFDDVMLERGEYDGFRAYGAEQTRTDPLHDRPRRGSGGTRDHRQCSPPSDLHGDEHGSRPGRYSDGDRRGGRGCRDAPDHFAGCGYRTVFQPDAGHTGKCAGL